MSLAWGRLGAGVGQLHHYLPPAGLSLPGATPLPARNAAMQRDEHEVEEGTQDGHSHDHAHAVPHAPTRPHTRHAHWHRHLEDREADAKLNGHTHPLERRRLPWEASESSQSLS